MIRKEPPFCGKRYLHNTNTNEVHDLLNESPKCKINKINHEHIEMIDKLFDVQLSATFGNVDGCAYCLKSLDKG